MAPALHAIYTSPDNQVSSRSFRLELQSPLRVTPDTPESAALALKTGYLEELRQLVPQLQDQINVFLTERMEEDKRIAEAAGSLTSRDDKKARDEEDNYGEEDVEDEES